VKHPRGNGTLLIAALLVACGSAEGDPGFSSNIGAQPPTGSLSRGPACSFYACFDACGQRVAVAPVEPAFGFSNAGSIPWQMGKAAPLDGDRVLTVNGQAAEVRSATDFSLLDRVPLPGAYRAATVGPLALVQEQLGALALLELSAAAPASVRAWWFDAGAGAPRLGLLGVVGERFVLRNLGGVSLVEVAADGPRETSCFQEPEGAGWASIELIGDVLAIAELLVNGEATQARLFRISDSGATEIGTLPLEAEIPFGGESNLLTLTSDNRRRLTLYDLSGEQPVEVAIADGVPTSTDEENSIGGFQLRGIEDQLVALDLRGGLARYDVTAIPGSECLWRLQSLTGTEAFIVSPLLGDNRLPPVPVPDVSCPARRAPYYASLGTLSPDGSTVIFEAGSGSGWVFLDVATGDERIVTTLPAGESVHWVGERLVIGRTEGSDWGIVVQSRLTVTSATRPETVIAELPSPGPVITLRATQRDVWGLSYAKNYEYGTAPPSARRLWRVDPGAPTPDIIVLEDVAVDDVEQLEASGDRVYVLRRQRVQVLDRDGRTLSEVRLPAVATSTAASERGFFMIDGAGTLSWLAADADSFSVLADCPGCALQSADATRVYVTAHAPRDARHPGLRQYDELLGYSDLLAYELDTGTLVGRQPISPSVTPLRIAAGRVVSISGTVLALRPSSGR
jgi:hypothetical protein